MKLRTLKVILALLSLICILLSWKLTMALGGTEFSGGRITGPLCSMPEFALLLFTISLILVIRLPRTSAAFVSIAALLCIPLSFLLLAPGPFRRITGGEWTVPLQSNFVLSLWNVGWGFALAACLVVSIAIPFQPRSGERIEPRA